MALSMSEPALPQAQHTVTPPEHQATVDRSVEDQIRETWEDPPGIIGWFSSLQNDALGTRIMGTAFLFFLVRDRKSVV